MIFQDTMGSPLISIYFEYGGHYTISEKGYEWHPKDSELYGITFKTSSMAEITYAELVSRICKKVGVDESKTRLRISFIPLVLQARKKSNVRDDDDVYLYLNSLDSEQRRSILNVEVDQDTPKKSSICGNFNSDNVSCYRPNVETSPGFESGNHLAIVPRYSTATESDNENGMGNGDSGDDDDDDDDDDDVANDIADGSVGNDGTEDGQVHVSHDSHYAANCVNVDLPHAGEESDTLEAWEDGLNLEIGREFESKQAVKDLIDRGSHEKCFGTFLANSDKTRYVVKCSEVKNGCKWFLRAAKVDDSSHFTIRTYNKMHTCSRASSSANRRRRGTPRLVASIIKQDYPGKFETPSPKCLIGLVQGRIGVEVSYSTAARGKSLAVSEMWGTPEEGYKNLFSFLHMLQMANPGTKTNVLLEKDKRFKYLFIALGACIEGFKAMRKVIIVDATFLKSAHGGVLVFATAQDPNRHVYPLAFAVLNGENDASYRWFFKNLKTVIADSSELVFVSDRHASLIKAVGEVYPSSRHGYCIRHLEQNVKTKVAPAIKKEVGGKFQAIAHIYREVDFLREYEDFRIRYPTVATYLDDSVTVDKWAKCYFPGERYNIDTSNCAECLNSVFNAVRNYALLPLIDKIVRKISEWSAKHRRAACRVPESRKLVPDVENLLHARCEEAWKLTVIELNAFELEYSVIGLDGENYVVDLRHKTCTCKCFDIDKYPCVHALGAFYKYVKQDVRPTYLDEIHDLCSPYYYVDNWIFAYSITIFPVPGMAQWNIPDAIKNLFSLPPTYKKRKGRRQQKRFPSVGESRKRNKFVPNRNLASYFECGPQD